MYFCQPIIPYSLTNPFKNHFNFNKFFIENVTNVQTNATFTYEGKEILYFLITTRVGPSNTQMGKQIG